MAEASQLPCDGEGACMLCGVKPSVEELLTCCTCVTPWHVACLAAPPPTLASTLNWECPDCSAPAAPSSTTAAFVRAAAAAADESENSGDLIAAVRAIEADPALTERQKARRRQQLVGGGCGGSEKEEEDDADEKHKGGDGDASRTDALEILGDNFKCAICIQLLDRPVTTPCGHNFCLKCFQKWIGQGKRTCAQCRRDIPPSMASQPRINSAVVAAIRTAKVSKSMDKAFTSKVYHALHNQDRPDAAFTTERAKKAGKANAASGKIFVTNPGDFFGPITAEYDPIRKQGVLVGESWADRLECRQWGAHLPHVAGISGQSKYGAQSVALSGGYEDDEDHGEWFLYTGSGGRDLSGNRRTNEQSYDQIFEKYNQALKVSCLKGYPVRVVRSYKEKRSSYAPTEGIRYDGIYRIEKCWRKKGMKGFKVCRYLFVRCDNEPAPWTSDVHGDCPRHFPTIAELKDATDLTDRKGSPSWDFDKETGCWKWKKPPPRSIRPVDTQDADGNRVRTVRRKTQNVKQKLLKEFSCSLCHKVMTSPLTTPCAHNFCKGCLEGVFDGKPCVRERGGGRRALRVQKNVMKCPSCSTDITEFLQNPQVNKELSEVIESLQRKAEEDEDALNETSNEESDGPKENLEVESGIVETDVAASEEIGVVNALPDPVTKCKPGRPHKRHKVDTEDPLVTV